jgi:K+-sensing histidine kinase KdpD
MSASGSKSWNTGFGGDLSPNVDASWQKRYGVACVLVLAAFLLRLTLFGSLDTRLPFAFFYVAVMIAAWYGGLGPGLSVIGAALLLAGLFFLPRTGVTGVMGEADRTVILLFIINGALVSFLMENLHQRIKKLRGEQDKTK